MKALGLVLSVSILASCGSGGGGLITSQSQISQAQTVSPSASTGFATAGDTLLTPRAGTEFASTAREVRVSPGSIFMHPFDRTNVEIAYMANGEIDLTVGPSTYRLSPDATQGDNVDANNRIRLSLSEQNRFSAFYVATKTDAYSPSVFAGVIGYSTNPDALPARASYIGHAALTAITETSGSDLALGTAVMNADFTKGRLEGRINISDPKGDASGPVDIGNVTATFDNPLRSAPIVPSAPLGPATNSAAAGNISGNSFAASVAIPSDTIFDMGLLNDPSLVLRGGFYGPNADHAMGHATGKSRAAGASDVEEVLLNLFVSSDRQ